MEYITHRRFKGKGISGDLNIPAQTICDVCGKYIICSDKAVCFTTSQIAHDYFAVNDDGMGMERGRLTRAIIKRLGKKDDAYQDRWDLVWDDHLCQKYKRPESIDYWLWSHEFYNAPIVDLQYIAGLIGIKEVGK